MLRALAAFLFLLVLAAAGAGGYLYWKGLQPHESLYDPIIASVAHHEEVDPFLIRALIWRESRFDPLTHGGADEHGLMQVTPEVGRKWAQENKVADYKDDDLYIPETNIRAGTWYLKRALKHWEQTDDPVSFALAEYNAGRKNALRWVDPLAPLSHTAFLDRITYPGTRKYVEVIQVKRDEFRRDFAGNRWYQNAADAPAAVTRAP